MKKLLVIILLAVIGAARGAAQDAKVRSFEAAPMDVTAQKLARLDLHGEKCALVKVQVIATGLEFSGNVMGDVAKHGSEYWVYMTDGTKMLKITADELLKLNIISGIIPEPDGGAQNDPLLTAKSIKSTIVENLRQLMQLSRDQLRLQRYAAIRRIGIYNDAKRADNQEKKGLLHND